MVHMENLSKTVAILVFVLLSDLAFAGVYKWTDENGQVHYGERPPETPADVSEVTVEDAPPTAANAEERLLQYQKSGMRRGRIGPSARRSRREPRKRRRCARKTAAQQSLASICMIPHAVYFIPDRMAKESISMTNSVLLSVRKHKRW